MCLFKMKKKKRADNFGNLSSKCQCFKTFCYIAPWMMLVSTLWIFIIHGRELHHYWLYVRNCMKIFSLFRSIEEPVDQIFCSKVDKITLPAEIYLFLQKPKGRKHFRANIFLILWCRHILFIGLSNILLSPNIEYPLKVRRDSRNRFAFERKSAFHIFRFISMYWKYSSLLKFKV